jgi:hypothetical protein
MHLESDSRSPGNPCDSFSSENALAFGFANRSIYPDLTLPASLTLMTVGAMSTVLAAMIKHRFIRFPTKKN